VRRIRQAPAPCLGNGIRASVLDNPIGRSQTRSPARDADKYRLEAWISADDRPETFSDSFGLFRSRFMHQQADLSLAKHSCQI
jgi:hypothetical protein